MTSPSRRRLRTDLEEIAAEGSTDWRETLLAWFREYVLEKLQSEEGEVAIVTPMDDQGCQGVAVYVDRERNATWRLPIDDLPRWVDADADLPIRGTARENPFIVADFSGVSG